MAEGFKDLFSGQASDYAKFRPRHYPDELFQDLARAAPGHGLAWDAGTGNGQAALKLTGYFEQVVATDPSAAQLRSAPRHERIRYHVAKAEAPLLPPASVDLVTVAQAFHWFDREAFYAEVQRVAKPSALLAIWTYGLAHIDPAVDVETRRFYFDVTGPFWEPERKEVDDAYRSVRWPFAELTILRRYEMCEHWNMRGYAAYINTWSVMKKAAAALGYDPLELFLPRLKEAWGDPDVVKEIRWPIGLRVARVQ